MYWDKKAYNVVILRRRIYARRDCSSSSRAAFWWVFNALEARRNHHDRHPDKVTQTNELLVGRIAYECVNCETLLDLPDQPTSSSLCLPIGKPIKISPDPAQPHI